MLNLFLIPNSKMYPLNAENVGYKEEINIEFKAARIIHRFFCFVDNKLFIEREKQFWKSALFYI